MSKSGKFYVQNRPFAKGLRRPLRTWYNIRRKALPSVFPPEVFKMTELFAQPLDSLQEIFDTAPAGSRIRLAPGEYRQKVMIRTPGLVIEGAGQDKTVIVWDDYAQKRDEFGREYVTFRTWTVAVTADDITLRHLTVSNDALDPGTKGQEVALTVYGDRFFMEDSTLRSTQDTLFLGPLPKDLIARYDGFLTDDLRADRLLSQHFSRCRIEGTVDFIFGCGAAVFEDCEIRSLYERRGTGYIAAPAHALSQTEGFLFRNCRLSCEDAVPAGSVFLARPWRDYGLCRFENCRQGRHIAPVGFDPWNDTRRDLTARFFEEPPVPGRVPWINRQSEA